MKGVRIHHVQAHGEKLLNESVCEECLETFTWETKDGERRFCSQECADEAKRDKVKVECDMCNRGFSAEPARGRKYCCEACEIERRVKRPRPDDEKALVWLLFIYEDFTRKEAFQRARAVLGYDDRLYRKEVDEIINKNGWEKKNRLASKVKGLHANDNTMPKGDDSWKQLHSD